MKIPMTSQILQVSCLVLSCIAFGPTPPVSGQVDRIVLSSENDRNASEIGFALDLSLDPGPAGGFQGTTEVVWMDSLKRYYVVPPPKMNQILVFDSLGNFVSSVGDEQGRGPGTFIMSINGLPGDSLQVFHGGPPASVSVISPDGNVVGEQLLPGMPFPNGARRLSDGNIVFNADLRTPERIGYPLHLLRPDGTVIRSLGATVPTYRPGDYPHEVLRRLAISSDGSIWAASVNRYRLQLWDQEGHLVKEVVRQVDWFKPWRGVGSRTESGAEIEALALALREDSAGRLWILLAVSAKTPVDPIHSPLGSIRGPVALLGEQERFHSVIEVIDPLTREVLASERFPVLLSGFLADGRVFGFDRQEPAPLNLLIWRAQIMER